MFGFNNNGKGVKTSEGAIAEILSRGVAEIVEKKTLEAALRGGKELRVKFGVDPTSPNIHIGRAVVLWKLRALQDLGHKIVLIVGDFTGEIGDTSDKESERPKMASEEVKNNLKTYFEQMGKIINLSKAEKHYNSKWLSKLPYKEISEQADQFSLSDFIGRELIRRRLDSGTRVSLREVLYPLMQGYDSVAVKADLELGGTDQRFNILAGRPLQSQYKQKPQQMLLVALLPGLDGRKMSSSWGNTINITDVPSEMYGKVMSLKDELLEIYFDLATNVSAEEVVKIKGGLQNKSLHPKETKMRLAREIISLYYDKVHAEEAEKDFIKTFSQGGEPDNVNEVFINEGVFLADALISEKIISSKSEFARLVEQGAVEIIGGEKVGDLKETAKKGVTYKIGKHRFLKTK